MIGSRDRASLCLGQRVWLKFISRSNPGRTANGNDREGEGVNDTGRPFLALLVDKRIQEFVFFSFLLAGCPLGRKGPHSSWVSLDNSNMCRASLLLGRGIKSLTGVLTADVSVAVFLCLLLLLHAIPVHLL